VDCCSNRGQVVPEDGLRRLLRSSWSGEDDQLNGRLEVTVVVRSIPGLSV
jgi:hypothetical protein